MRGEYKKITVSVTANHVTTIILYLSTILGNSVYRVCIPNFGLLILTYHCKFIKYTLVIIIKFFLTL